MANLWKRIVKQQMVEEHENDPKYQWETYAKVGWHKREQVAEALDCHEDKVQGVLKSAIASKKIERQEMTIWDKLNKELIKIVAYREKGRHADAKEDKPAKSTKPAKRSKRPKPAVGMVVRSRTGGMGKIAEVRAGRMKVEWDSGKVTEPAVKAIAKGDICLEF
jgi:hypothetical protein